MAEFQRLVTKEKLAQDLDFEDPAAVIGAWRERIEGWYFEPIEYWPRTGHEAFVCLLAMKEVLYACATVFHPEEATEHGATRILGEIAPMLREEPVPGQGAAAERLARALGRFGTGEIRMRKNEGISGTGVAWKVCEGGIIVFDPWVIRDLLRSWFAKKCEALLGEPEGGACKAAHAVLREKLSPGES